MRIRNGKVLACMALLVSLLFGESVQRFEVRGLLLKVDVKNQSILISQEAIPGYMDAMVMSYHLPSGRHAASLKPGSKIEFTLIVAVEQASVSNIRELPYDSVEREPLQAKSLAMLDATLPSAELQPQVRIGQQVPDFSLIDQTGSKVSLSQFAGKVVGVTFIYTRCPLPQYCFRLSNNFGRLQKKFQSRMGIDLVLLSITFDPINDTPSVLARYGQTWQADTKGWHLLTGPPESVKRVGLLLGSHFWPDEGVLTHSLHTFIIDREGRLAADIEGNQYTADQLAELVQAYF
jgi:protein SCO1/2